MKLLTKLALGAGTLIAVKGLDNRLEVTRYELKFDTLPLEFDGFRITHISDLHSENTPGLTEEVSFTKPDIIVVTGDMIHDDNRSFEPVLALLERLLAIAPVYIVSGNHDLWNSRFDAFLAAAGDMGVVFCDDTLSIISRGEAQIGIFGIKDPFSKSPAVIRKNIEHSLSELPDFNGFKCLLFHRANQFELLRGMNFDLILSGHMHGGQMRIPGVGGVISPKTNFIDSRKIFFPTYCSGAFKYRTTTMIVNRGIGNPMLVPRLFNRPEIGVITLKCNNTHI